MKYALNLGTNGRIQSVTYQQYASSSAIIVATLPDGNINDYRYEKGQYMYDPLPQPEHVPTQIEILQNRVTQLQTQNAMLEECILEITEQVYA